MHAVPLSVCIPTYERLGYLKEAVASAQNQSLANIEILIGDDGNSGELREWAEAAARNDPRIRYHKTPRRLRLAGNWDFLAGLARGEFLNLIGDDDLLLPSFAERMVSETKPGVSVVFANHFFIDARGERLPVLTEEMTRHYRRTELVPGLQAEPGIPVWRNSVPMSSAIVRTADVQRLHFKTDINTPEIELYARLASQGAGFVFVPEYLGEFRSHDGSQTASGLSVDRLAEHLIPIPAAADAEADKRALLGSFLLAGVTMRLSRGDVAGAKRLRRSSYYPPGTLNPTRIVQDVCLALPPPIAAPAFRGVRQALQRVRAALRPRATAV